MCGIAGTINLSPDEAAILQSLRHRGPDASGSLFFENLALFHTRLSIQDLSASANQPMEMGDLAIVFNGEIYNHRELRAKIPDFAFQTQSDTETILALFAAFGASIFAEFDGMFALAILDKSSRTLTFARDKMGKKPLFCYHNGEHFAFASELATLARCAPLEIELESLRFFLRFGFFYSDGAPYQHVFALPPAHTATLALDSLRPLQPVRYFDLRALFAREKVSSLPHAMACVEDSLRVCVKRRLESSSIEVGSFLSGGSDSSLVVAIASEFCPSLQTCTVAFEGMYDESPLAALVAEKYHTRHSVLHIDTKCLADDIEGILRAYGRPFMDSSAIPSYYVAKEAKKHVSVILNGDGADELFGGYRRYVPFALGWVGAARALSWLVPFLPKSHNQKSLYTYALRLLSMAHKQGAALYASATIDSFEDCIVLEPCGHTHALDTLVRDVCADSRLSPLSKWLYLDSQLLLLCDLLPKMDIATMQHALEARSPFLGSEVIESSTSISDSLKIKNRHTKYILRELAKKYLPPELVSAPKRGFEVPLAHWVAHELRDVMTQRISSCTLLPELLPHDFIQELLHKPQNFATQKRAKMLVTLFALAVWAKR